MALLSNAGIRAGAAGVPTGPEPDKGVVFNTSDTTYFSRTPSSAGNQKTWSFSCWVKKPNVETYSVIFSRSNDGNNGLYRFVLSMYNGILYMFSRFGSGGAHDCNVSTQNTFRDGTGWYHILFVLDTTQSTAADRTKIYVNGVAAPLTYSVSPGENDDLQVNSTNEHRIGSDDGSTTEDFNGYLANIHFIDGAAKVPSDFTETDSDTGQLVAKEYTGSYGTNGFYLDFKDNSGATATTLGKDSSGNGNNWTPNNISVAAGTGNDSVLDCHSNNYCTINGLDTELSMHSVSRGNLHVSGDTTAASGTDARWNGTLGASSGKWYYEVYIDSGDTNQNIGISYEDNARTTTMGNLAGDYQYTASGNKRNNNSSTSWGNTWTTGDYIGVAYDLDANKIWFSKNGTWQESGNPAAGSNEAFALAADKRYRPAGRFYNSSGTFNFGQREFEHSAPTGFKALCTSNLADPPVKKPNTAFDIVLYEGDGQQNRSISALNFQPELVWFKNRDDTNGQMWCDAARGATKVFYSHLTFVEHTESQSLTAFESDGWKMGDFANNNANNMSYVTWCWDAGTGAASASTAGSTNATDSWVNTTAGFSITEWEGTGSGTTVGHSLGAIPHLIITRNRDLQTNMAVYHHTQGNEKSILMNSDGSGFTPTPAGAAWNSTSPTDTVFSVGSYGSNNGDGDSMVAYCWTEVDGFSRFGSFEGNGSADGPYIHCGFRPKYLMLKAYDQTYDWHVIDNARNPWNGGSSLRLKPNQNHVEVTGSHNVVDFLSQGFKMRNGDNNWNHTNNTIIYVAFADTPSKYSRAG